MRLGLILSILAALAWADGGTVQLHKEVDGMAITVFAAPSPLSNGPTDFSLLVQKFDGLEAILDADVRLTLRNDDSGTELRLHPTREQARNKLLYAASAVVPEAGKWRIEVTVGQSSVTGTVEVGSAPYSAPSYAGFVAFPPAAVILFVIHQRLIRRRLQ